MLQISQILTQLFFSRLLAGSKVQLYLASNTSTDNRRVLFDSPVQVDQSVCLSERFRDALKVVTQTSNETYISQIELFQHGKDHSFTPAQVTKSLSGLIIIIIIVGEAPPDQAFKLVVRWMLDGCESSETEEIFKRLSFIDLAHCMGDMGLLAVPMLIKDQVHGQLVKITDDQVPLSDVKALYAQTTERHPARAVIIETVGRAYVEKCLKDEEGYHQYCDENNEFKKDLQQYVHQVQISGGVCGIGSETATEVQASSYQNSKVPAGSSDVGILMTANRNSKWDPAKAVTANSVPKCSVEAFQYSAQTYVPKPMISFDGPADGWETQAAPTGTDWNPGSAEWQDTSAAAGGADGGWDNTGAGSNNNNNGWSDQAGGYGGAAAEDDDTCRRCKQSGHFARECPVPRDDSCFNCGQPGHISRDCTEPKKPRGGDRTCRKCNEVGHIARDCPTGAGGGGDRACHKCNEVGHMIRDCPNGGGGGGDRTCRKCGEAGHIARDCTSSVFGAAAGGAGGGMKCYNCQEYGHRSSECTNEAVEREYGSDPRTCNKCGQQGHISRDCREAAGDSYSMEHGGGYGEPSDPGYYGGEYDGQGELFDPAANLGESAEPIEEKTIHVTISAPRVRKGKKGRLGYVDITQQMYDPHAFDRPDYDSYNGGGQRREGRGGRGGRGGERGGGRGRGGRGGRRNAEDDGGHGGDFANENVAPAATTDVPAVAIEGDWAGAGDDSTPAAAGW